MLKQFYEKALPTQGVYCISGIDNNKRITNRFAETLDDVLVQVEKLKSKGSNTFVALGAFEGYSRKAEDCLFLRSFFIDLDVGPTKEYSDKVEANVALYKLCGAAELPDPTVIDSGGGLHAYWIFDKDIPVDEWKLYAEKFKALCMSHIAIDPVVTADAARIMRAPETFNHKFDPPEPTSVISNEINIYSWDEMKVFLGGTSSEEEQLVVQDVLASVPKGLDDDTRAILKLDNFTTLFSNLVIKSLEGSGCEQVKFMVENAATLEEPVWFAGLSIARHCDDGATAIHDLSNEHPDYDYKKTEEKATRFKGPRLCEWFAENYPTRCNGCAHQGKISSPIQLGREFKAPAVSDKEESVWEAPSTEKVLELPSSLFPFVRGVNGGVYVMPAPVVDKKGVKHQDDPVLILPNDLYPIARMVSPHDGECLEMRYVLPHDGAKEFLLPMKAIYAKETLKALLSSNGVLFSSMHDQHLMNYLIKWGQYLQTQEKALQMRMQMGWTAERTNTDWANRSFVIGKSEITRTGETIVAPSSPFVRQISRHLNPYGTFERWRESLDFLNNSGFELHAFASMCGLGSTLMPFTSTSGVTVCLSGRSGNAKTGALYAGLSMFGNPKDLSVVNGTDNGFTQRYLGMHNLMFGLDEAGDKKTEDLGKLIHDVSHGKAKIRMQGSINAEREYEMSASMIAMLTTNTSIYSKLGTLKAAPDGEVARLIEFLVHKPPMIEKDSRLGVKIFDAFRYNYGHAGPMFIKDIMEKGDNYIEDNILHWGDRFLKDFGDYNEYRFYQNLIGTTFGAGSIANNTHITAYNLETIYHQTVLAMINIRDDVVKVNAIDYPSILGDFINKNLGNILVIKAGVVSMEPRNHIVARLVSDENLLQVSKSELKKYLAERHISSREFEFDMQERKQLVDMKKGRLTTGWKSAVSADPAYLYWFDTPIFNELLNAPD
tara:strand:+ start:1450 stop:4278 length:2829 start_codon:yes stop_codon:yes gene_type:complete